MLEDHEIEEIKMSHEFNNFKYYKHLGEDEDLMKIDSPSLPELQFSFEPNESIEVPTGLEFEVDKQKEMLEKWREDEKNHVNDPDKIAELEEFMSTDCAKDLIKSFVQGLTESLRKLSDSKLDIGEQE